MRGKQRRRRRFGAGAPHDGKYEEIDGVEGQDDEEKHGAVVGLGPSRPQRQLLHILEVDAAPEQDLERGVWGLKVQGLKVHAGCMCRSGAPQTLVSAAVAN